VTTDFGNDGSVSAELVGRLRLWTERLIRISISVRECRFNLAELGVVCGEVPRIQSTDSPRVVRVKESLRALIHQKKKILGEMLNVGALLISEQSWEVLLPGGPAVGFLSWIPGEGTIGFYRETNSLLSTRQRLPGVDRAAVDPICH
jgi:hypothetical protein